MLWWRRSKCGQKVTNFLEYQLFGDIDAIADQELEIQQITTAFMREHGRAPAAGESIYTDYDNARTLRDGRWVDISGRIQADHAEFVVVSMGIGAWQAGVAAAATNATGRQIAVEVGKSVADDVAGEILGVNPRAATSLVSALRSSPDSFFSYKELRGKIRELGLSGRGRGLEAHHLVEKRFAQTLGLNQDEIIAVALTPQWHRNVGRWGESITPEINRQLKLMGTNPASATAEQIWRAHRETYRKLGKEEWSQAIHTAYFEPLGIDY